MSATTTLPLKRSASETFSDSGENKNPKTETDQKKEDDGMLYMQKEFFRSAKLMFAACVPGVSGYGNHIDWRRYGALLPKDDGEVPAFFYMLLQQHSRDNDGSYELQLIVHALRFYANYSSHLFGDEQGRYRTIIDEIVKYVKSQATDEEMAEIGEWTAYQLRQKTPIVFFGDSAVVPYRSFLEDTWHEFTLATTTSSPIALAPSSPTLLQ